MRNQPEHDIGQRLAVVIADDHPLFRKGLRQSIEEDGSFVVVGEGGDGDRALQLIEDNRPDLAVLDITENGFLIQSFFWKMLLSILT